MNRFLKFALGATIAFSAMVAHAETYALMIGINDYPTPTDEKGQPMKDEKGNVIDNDLRGPKNDVKSIQDLMLKNYGVKSSNIKSLLDKDASGKNLLESLKWIMNSAKPGDQVVLFYSGHGGQIPTEDKSEKDGKDEVFVLADGALVVDDLINDLRNILTTNGINFTGIFDSCFSGGMSRDAGPNKRFKFLPNVTKYKNYKTFKAKLPSMPAVRPNATTKAMASKGSFAFLYAGREDQPTIDLGSDDPKVESHGLFTLALTAIVSEEPTAPAKPVIEAIASFLKDNEIDQEPTFEFSDEDRSNQPIILVAK